MIRYGKPIKNKKRSDPRYFLNENLEEDDGGDSVVSYDLAGIPSGWMQSMYNGYDRWGVADWLNDVLERHYRGLSHQFQKVGFLFTGVHQGGSKAHTISEPDYTPAIAFEEQPGSDRPQFETLLDQSTQSLIKKLTDVGVLGDVWRKIAKNQKTETTSEEFLGNAQKIFSNVTWEGGIAYGSGEQEQKGIPGKV